MAGRRDKKRNARPQNEAKRRSLLELGPAVDPRGEPPTIPMMLVRPTRKTSLPPAPAEPMADASLASLALATRRGAADLMERMSTNRSLSDYPPRTSVPPPPPPPAAAADDQPPSVAPPPVQVPSEPPRAPRRREGSLWLRTLGVIVLSASVGAVVSSAISEVKRKLEPVAALRDTTVDAQRGSATTPICTTAAPALDAKPVLASAAPSMVSGSSESTERAHSVTPRISLDALPLQQGPRREPSERRRESSSERRDERAVSVAAKVNLDSPSPKRELRSAPEPPPERELPDQPSRKSITDAVRRASGAAASCDSGPQDGTVTVTFAPSGAVQSVSLVKGFGDATLNACVLRAFGRARVPAFSGEPVRVRKTITW
jgi:hypothetical protein